MLSTTFGDDDRAIEGLPVRLVIAFVVGVASLSVMLDMLTGVQGLAVTELDVKPEPEVVETGPQSLALTVVGPDGPVPDATVIVRSGTAVIDGVVTARTDENGTANVDVAPRLPPGQSDGTLTVEVKPPAGSQFVDRRENAYVLVVG